MLIEYSLLRKAVDGKNGGEEDKREIKTEDARFVDDRRVWKA